MMERKNGGVSLTTIRNDRSIDCNGRKRAKERECVCVSLRFSYAQLRKEGERERERERERETKGCHRRPLSFCRSSSESNIHTGLSQSSSSRRIITHRRPGWKESATKRIESDMALVGASPFLYPSSFFSTVDKSVSISAFGVAEPY